MLKEKNRRVKTSFLKKIYYTLQNKENKTLKEKRLLEKTGIELMNRGIL